MEIWTYHPGNFRIDDRRSPGIDPTRGPYWSDATLCYEESLHILLELLGTDQFPLWCFTVRGWILTDVTCGPTEWELGVPESEILGFIREPIWEAILRRQGSDWDNVILKERPVTPARDITAVVKFPLLSHWSAICHGRVVPEVWRSYARCLERLPRKKQMEEIQSLRASAADPANVAPELDAGRADYLEEVMRLN